MKVLMDWLDDLRQVLGSEYRYRKVKHYTDVHFNLNVFKF